MPPLATIGLILGVAGTGLSYSAQMSAARTSETFSMLNAQAGAQQATQQSSIAALQAQLQATQADTAARAAADNAEAIRAEAEADAAVGQENIRRNRDEFTRQLAIATAEAGGSGAVVATGSPLDFLVNAADAEAQEERGAGYLLNSARAAANRRAAGVALGGRVEGLNASLFQLQGLAAVQEGRMGVASARLGGLAGRAQAGGMRSAAFGGLIGGLAGAASSYAGYKRTRY